MVKKRISKKKAFGEKILSNYMKKALRQGHSPEEIKHLALKKGWPKRIVEHILHSFVRTKEGKVKNYFGKRLHKVSSGIKALDSLLRGGFKERSLNLVAGPLGSGKTIFAVKFLMEGIKNNEASMYITFEEDKEEFYYSMLQFGWDLKKYETEGRFVFVYCSPEQVESIINGGSSEVIQELIDECKVTRLAIDSLTSFSLLYKDSLTRKGANLTLFSLMRKWKCTSLLTVNDELLNNSSELGFESDGIIMLYHAKKKEKRVRALEILKMKGIKIPEETFPMKIDNKGITIDVHNAVVF